MCMPGTLKNTASSLVGRIYREIRNEVRGPCMHVNRLSWAEWIPATLGRVSMLVLGSNTGAATNASKSLVEKITSVRA